MVVMSLTLADFQSIVTSLLGNTVASFQMLRDSYLIEDGAIVISLFTIILGFVILEFFVWILNKMRGDTSGLSTSTGSNPSNRPNQYGGFGNKPYGPVNDPKYHRGKR